MSPETFEIVGTGLFVLGAGAGVGGRALYMHFKCRLAWRAIQRNVIERRSPR